MKKFIAAVVSAFAALTLCICLAACSSTSTITGTWKFESMTSTYEGQTVTYKVGDAAPWADGTDEKNNE